MYIFLIDEVRVYKLNHNSKCFDSVTGNADNQRYCFLLSVTHLIFYVFALLHFPAIDFYDCCS
jgi:hypothetical protein